MTGVWDIFLSITEAGQGYYVESRMDGLRAVRGVGTVRFRLAFGESIEVNGVLFVLGLRFNLLSVSTLEDEGYGVLFRSEHLFLSSESSFGRNHVAW